MRLIIIGSGYVGLVSGACLAELGHHVLCVDNDPAKIEQLQAGQIPIYEPQLTETITRNVARGRLGFTSRLPALGREIHAVMAAVGTPPQANGSADLSAIFAVAQEIAEKATHPQMLIIKSTVPVGTGDRVQALLQRARPDMRFSVISNPEFLREGSAIEDFMAPDRIIVGAGDETARNTLRALYAPLEQLGTPVVCMGRREAELVKCAANAFLATKIAFINECADLCEAVGADVGEVAHGIGLDSRIGEAFLQAGPGYGGSCFPKDTSALLAIAQEHGVNLRLVETVIGANEARKRAMGRRVTRAAGGSLNGRVVGVLGLTFKPNTDDMRDSPSLALIETLQRAGAKVQVFDPQGMAGARFRLRTVRFTDDAYACAEGADCLVLSTHWPEFADLDPNRLAGQMRGKVIVDLRNFLKAQAFVEAGFSVHAVGRPAEHPRRKQSTEVRPAQKWRQREPALNGAAPGSAAALHSGIAG
ncbi:UDP-glucose/GDP-mannose dehydrogenase family protein [uncultured Devosia sp.]|uniref:UDP-glucose dehydrogenase family protein n=1 Tax=uncultured Devosia sp. TaxID=211434 RepID=UPI002628EB50|nr:UDP-glucose/GDP-mannose dehydrogenase family protein [uncultured Devosia sp.]